MGSEKVIHGIRACVEKFWNDRDFSVMKVVFKNVSLQRCCSTGMCKAFPRFASMGCLVLWLSPFLWHTNGSADITIRCAAGRPTGFFSVCIGFA